MALPTSQKNPQYLLALLILLTSCTIETYAFVEGIYCGTDNCYDVLGVTRTSSKGEISKAYRRMARKYHPDRYKGEDAEEKFRKVATAYEILKDDEAKADYDYMLDNPEEAYYHYYRYYKRRMTPKVDVRIVIAATLSVISILQYLHKWHRYSEAVTYAMQLPKFRNQAMKVIHDEGLADKVRKGKGKRSKEEKKAEEERVLREVVENSIDIRGGYSKPEFTDVLWVQLLMSPYLIGSYVIWFGRWVVKFWILKHDYEEPEMEYLTKKRLGLSDNYWEALTEADRKSYIKQELWIKENYEKFNEEQEEEMRVKKAENGKHKMWRRWMKKGGPGQMTFQED